MSSKPLAEAHNVNKLLVKECNQIYPSLLQQVYIRDRPKSDLKEVLADDEWRYIELPGSLRAKGGLSKQQLARLVKWKM